MNEIAARLVAIRQWVSMTQKEFANMLGLSLGGLQKIEQSDSTPNGNTLLLYTIQGFNAHWILMGQGSMFAPTARPDAPHGQHDDPVRNAPQQPSISHQSMSQNPPATTIDTTLFAAVHSVVEQTFNELQAAPSAHHFIEETVHAYNAVVSRGSNSDEQHALLNWLAVHLRNGAIASKTPKSPA